jgi:hypothetical protein
LGNDAVFNFCEVRHVAAFQKVTEPLLVHV